MNVSLSDSKQVKAGVGPGYGMSLARVVQGRDGDGWDQNLS